MAYEVLGAVVAQVSGMSFEEYVQRRVLKPLGMNRSTFLFRDTEPDLRTIPHVGRRTPVVSEVYPYHRAHAPSSTMHSNVEELCRWILVHAQRGELDDHRILMDVTHAEMWAPHARVRADREMGLGWFVAESPYGPWFFHGGRDVGFRSHVSVLPAQRGGIVIIGNHSDLPIRSLREELIAQVFRVIPEESER